MLSKTFTLLFYLKKSKHDVDGKMPINMRFTIDRHTYKSYKTRL